MEMYNINEAFKALEDVSLDEINADLEKENQKVFSLSDEDIQEDPIEMITDIEADDEEELKDTYVGDVILQCNSCKEKIYRKEDDLVLADKENEEDEDVYNVDLECPHCHQYVGYELIGKVAPYDAEESEELKAEVNAEEGTGKDEEDIKVEDEVKDGDDEVKVEDEFKFEESLKESLTESDKPAAQSIEDAQKWVDYDMEHYGKISGRTNDLVKKAGFQIIKDDHGDYEVVAGKYESCKEECTKLDEKLNWELSFEDSDEKIVDGIDKLVSYASKKNHPFGTGPLPTHKGEKVYSEDGKAVIEVKEIAESCKEECKDDKCEEECKESCELKEAPIYDLNPQFDSRKSFYGKAKVDTGDKNDKNKLYSYNTLVAEIKDGKPVVYGTYSATTLRHIKDWLQQNGFRAVSAKQILADYGVKEESLEEAADVSDRVIVNKKEDGFINKMHELRDKGYKCIGSGDKPGEMIFAKPKEIKECDIKESSQEIDRNGFASLIKYDDPVFANAKYGVLNDGNFCYKFWAEDDEEAKKIFAARGVKCDEELKESLVKLTESNLPKEDKEFEDFILKYDSRDGFSIESKKSGKSYSLVEFKTLDGASTTDVFAIFDDSGVNDIDIVEWYYGASILDDYLLQKSVFPRIKEYEGIKESCNEELNALTKEQEEQIIAIFNDAYKEWTPEDFESAGATDKEDIAREAIAEFPNVNEQVIYDLFWEWANNLTESLKEEKCEECGDKDIKVEEIDENLFNTLVNNYIKEVYDNVDSYTTTGGSVDNKSGQIVLEGKINFKSGKSQDTKFVFENAQMTKKGKIRFVGLNETFTKNKKAFAVQGILKDNNFLTESFTYNYSAKTDSKPKRLYGTFRNDLKEELKVIMSMSSYKPWSGAEETYRKIVDNGLWEEFENMLEDIYPDGITETELNDLLWFDSDLCLELVGLKDEEEVEESLDESKKGFKRKYKGCSIHDAGDQFVVTNEHGKTIGQSKTEVGCEAIIDDYLAEKDESLKENYQDFNKVWDDIKEQIVEKVNEKFPDAIDKEDVEFDDSKAWSLFVRGSKLGLPVNKFGAYRNYEGGGVRGKIQNNGREKDGTVELGKLFEDKLKEIENALNKGSEDEFDKPTGVLESVELNEKIDAKDAKELINNTIEISNEINNVRNNALKDVEQKVYDLQDNILHKIKNTAKTTVNKESIKEEISDSSKEEIKREIEKIVENKFDGTDFMVSVLDIDLDNGILKLEVSAFADGEDGEMEELKREIEIEIPSTDYENVLGDKLEDWMIEHSGPDAFYEECKDESLKEDIREDKILKLIKKYNAENDDKIDEDEDAWLEKIYETANEIEDSGYDEDDNRNSLSIDDGLTKFADKLEKYFAKKSFANASLDAFNDVYMNESLKEEWEVHIPIEEIGRDTVEMSPETAARKGVKVIYNGEECIDFDEVFPETALGERYPTEENWPVVKGYLIVPANGIINGKIEEALNEKYYIEFKNGTCVKDGDGYKKVNLLSDGEETPLFDSKEEAEKVADSLSGEYTIVKESKNESLKEDKAVKDDIGRGYHCPKCGKPVYGYLTTFMCKQNYCPNCGTKIEIDKEDDSLKEDINKVVINPDEEDEIRFEADDIDSIAVQSYGNEFNIHIHKEEEDFDDIPVDDDFDGLLDVDIEDDEIKGIEDDEPYINDVEDEIEAEFGVKEEPKPVEMIAPTESSDDEVVSDEEVNAEVEAEFGRKEEEK